MLFVKLWWLFAWLFCNSYAGQWAVRLFHPFAVEEAALEVGLVVVGEVGALENTFLMETEGQNDEEVDSKLERNSAVVWYEKQVARRRARRQLQFSDPWYPQQWHLVRITCLRNA